MQSYRYKAFISYRHVERDRKWARWLMERLETFRTPGSIVQKGASIRIGKLFRDDDEIPASSNLSTQIEDALQQSEFLIVICSRDTPHSKWVQKEIEFFRGAGRGNRILALLVDGEPHEAFPPNLLRVSQERVLADGSTTLDWIDAEPIAADVRPRRDERRRVTERRAFLRIAAGLLGVGYDDLVRREQRRRARSQSIWGTMAAMLLLGAVGGAYEYWDYNTLHTRYYRNYGTRWGVPFGIDEISSETAAHRNVNYAIDTRRGRVVAMRRENGSHGLMPMPGDGIDGEAWETGITQWRVPFPADRAVQIDILGQMETYERRDRKLRSESFSWQPDGSAIVTFKDPDGAASTLRTKAFGSVGSFSGTLPRRSQIASNKLSFTPEGFASKREFQTVWGAGAQDSEGSFGRAYRYGAQGEMRNRTRLGSNGEPLADKRGVLGLQQTYDKNGECVLAEWVGITGKPAAGPSGYAIERFQRDEYGNSIREDFLGANGRSATKHPLDVSSVVRRYDGKGNEIAQSYYGGDGSPALRHDWAVWSIERRYNPAGLVVKMDYLGTNAKPTRNGDLGDWHRTYAYNNAGDEAEQAYYGPDGKPIALINMAKGAARITYRYDRIGNELEEDYFGPDGRPVLLSDEGFAGMTERWDRRGNNLEESYFDTDHKPVLSKDAGISRVVAEYDEHGNEVAEAYFGTAGEQVKSIDGGYSLRKMKYDDRGNEVEEDYYGPDGRSILRKDIGIARVAAEYDDLGNKVEEDYFDTDNRPILNGQSHAARIQYRYNAEGEVIVTTRYDVQGKLLRN